MHQTLFVIDAFFQRYHRFRSVNSFDIINHEDYIFSMFGIFSSNFTENMQSRTNLLNPAKSTYPTMQTQSPQVTLSLNESAGESRCVPILTFWNDNVLALHVSTDEFKGALQAIKIVALPCPNFQFDRFGTEHESASRTQK